MLQCRHLFPALNAWAGRAKYTTAPTITTQFSGHGCDHRSLTSQLKVALMRKLRGSLICRLTFLTCLYNQALADVRPNGAGTKCLYCRGNQGVPVKHNSQACAYHGIRVLIWSASSGCAVTLLITSAEQ